jgi:hypothetical protein
MEYNALNAENIYLASIDTTLNGVLAEAVLWTAVMTISKLLAIVL